MSSRVTLEAVDDFRSDVVAVVRDYARRLKHLRYADIRVEVSEGKAAADFFKGLFTTALGEGEIITRISFPVPGKFAYVKFSNPASRYALVGVAVAQTGSEVRVAVTGAGNVEVGLRVMADDLSPLPASVLAAGSIFMPNGATFPPVPSPKQQSFPQAAFAGGKYYIAFQDDDTAGNGLDIHLRSMDAAFVAGEGATPIGVNGTDGLGEANNQIVPAMAAGPKGRLYVAWEDTTAGKIAGRTVTPPNTLGNQNDLSTGTINTNVSVAATLTGWVAAWQSGTGIKLRVLNEDGTPQGADQSVSDPAGAATRPRVASLPDGRFAVAWVRDGDIYVQRYDGKGVKIAGDQAAPVNENTAGEQASPAIGGSSAVGGTYVVAWLDVGESHVHARMLGGSSGFLFNNVDGQAGDFKASIGDGRTRKTPVVIAGGAAPFVAIGWEDATAGGAGIVVRRFPVPTD